jgi:transcriptional regulator with XRE-family HTH domain
MPGRPVFHEQIGQFFTSLREEKGWTQRQAADIARRRRLRLSKNVLWRLETGKVKNPEPDVLRAVAALYEKPYEDIAGRIIAQRYGFVIESGDLVRPGTEAGSETSPGGADVPASARRIAELESELEGYKARWGEMQTLAKSLFQLAVRGKEGRAAARAAARRSGARRGTAR